MKPRELPSEYLEGAELRAARRALLQREYASIKKMQDVLRAAIEAEAAAGINVCSPYLRVAHMAAAECICAIAETLYGERADEL